MKVSRRKLIVGAAMLGAAGVLGVLRSRGYALPKPEPRLVSLEPWQYLVVVHLARRIAAPDVNGVDKAQASGSVVSPDDVDVAGFIDKYIASMRPKLKKDLLAFLGLLEQVLPLSSGHVSRFTQLDEEAQDDVLRKLEASESEMLRGGFQGMKSLVFMGYYRDPRTWAVLGYEGPWVTRKEAT
jgi:hypothetical protein